MIAIQTKTENHVFGSSKGRVVLTVDLYQGTANGFALRIIDSVTKEVTEKRSVPAKDEDGKIKTDATGNIIYEDKDVTFVKTLEQKPPRIKELTIQEVDALTASLFAQFSPNTMRKDLEKKHLRIKELTKQEVDASTASLSAQFSLSTMRKDLEKTLQLGLLVYIKMECTKGINEPGVGMYFTTAADWEEVITV